MGLLSLFGSGRTPRRPRVEPTLNPAASAQDAATTTLAEPDAWFVDWAMGGRSQSFGPPVNERTAMCVSAVYRAVTLNMGVVGGMAMKVFRRTETGREEAADHRLTRLFKVAPYPGRPMTAFAWREIVVANVLLWGNHYSIIRYDNAGRVIGLEPVWPWNVEVLRQAHARRNLYRCILEDGTSEYVDQEDMIHIAGPGFDGIHGLSRIQSFARDSIALAKLLEEQTGQAHANAARPSGFVEVPPSMKPDAFARMKAQFNDLHGGWQNSGKVYFGDQGAKFTPLQMTPVDLATLESRRYQVADISRFFGVPLHLLNETDKSTSWGSGLAEQNLAWLTYSLNADLARIEAELNYKLLDGTDCYIEFHRDTLLEMDPAKAASVAQTEISSGTLTINEYRKLKNRPPVEGGDRALVNSTNVPLDRQLAPPQPAPAAPQGGNGNA